MKKYIYEKAITITIVLSFAMIAGLLGGMKLDARAEGKTMIEAIDITMPEPVAGESLPDITQVMQNIPGTKVTNLEWYEGIDVSVSTGIKVTGSNAKANTQYTVVIQCDAEDGYYFGTTMAERPNVKLNNQGVYLEWGAYECRIVYTFPATGSETTHTINSVNITIAPPEAGKKFADTCIISTPGVKVEKIKWLAAMTDVTGQVAGEKSVYQVRVYLKPEDNYEFGRVQTIVNGDTSEGGFNYPESYVHYTFPATGLDQTKTINSVDITVDRPVAGQNLVDTCKASTLGVRVSGVKWLYTDDREYAYGRAEYNTEYKVQVELVPETDYKFAPISKIKATVNGQDETQLLEGNSGNIYVRYTFPATDPKPSDEGVEITEGNNSTYKPGSNESLTFRGTGDLTEFQYVKVDGNIVDPKNYDKSKGSTIITFKPEYLKTLSNGPHTVEMIWKISGEQKSATASFYVGEKGGEIVPGNTGTTQPANNSESKPRHTCNFEWVITLDPTTGADGLEEYKCTGCGIVKESHPIPASVAVVKDFYGKVKEAPENGNITYDAGKLYTISDYILKKMAERNDVTVTVKFEYQNKKYQLTFPAGLNYSAVLTDEETMYGYFGAAAKLGLKVTEQ